jgi:hypothetical protein
VRGGKWQIIYFYAVASINSLPFFSNTSGDKMTLRQPDLICVGMICEFPLSVTNDGIPCPDVLRTELGLA